MNCSYSAVSGPAPAGSRNSPPTAPSASYPVVPAHRQSAGSRSSAGEDLLGDHPQAAGPPGQPGQVAARVGQPVGVVDPQPVDEPVRHQAENHLVGGVEHRGVLHPDRDQRADVEEPPPVQLGRGRPPVRQPVVLGGQQVRQRQVHGAGPDREHVVEVAQHRLAAPPVHRQVAQAVPGRPGQDGQQQPAVLRGPVHVEPGRERRAQAVPEHRPERPVQRLGHRHGHVVGHDVQHDAEPVPAELGGHVPECRLAAEVGRHPGVIHHVVAVHRARRGLQDRRQVGVADAQRGQVAGDPGRLGEAEPGVQLEPVGGDWLRHG